MTADPIVTAARCSVDGCDRPFRCRGLCKLHYDRLLRTGTTTRQAFPDTCTIESCEKPHRARGYCATHWKRWSSHGDPMVVMPNPASLPGEQSPYWGGNDVTYGHVHRRLRRAKGSATDRLCAHCGGAAAEWAYDHLDPDERRSADALPYSPKMEHYRPLCRKCHWREDHCPSERWTQG